MSQNAAVKSQLSTRARTLSQRRKARTGQKGGPVDLSGQDAPMEHRDSGLWVPADQHRATYEDGEVEVDEEDEEEEDEETLSAVNGEIRGREEQRAVAV